MKKSLLLLFLVSALFSCNNKQKESKYTPQLQESVDRGEIVYNDFCARCHAPDNKEFPDRYPPLIGSNWLAEKRKQTIHTAKYGRRGLIVVNGREYNDIMIPVRVTDQQIMDVLNYALSFGELSEENMYTLEEVKSIPKKMERESFKE